jgi:uncharacterized protein
MLLEFSVGNFRSIRDIESISFVASSVVSKNKEVDETNVFQATDKVRGLKTLAIYGANASGKSNFIKALQAFTLMIGVSLSEKKLLSYAHQPYLLSTETVDKPTFFQAFFMIEGITYRYGFELTKDEIVSEWLFGTPNTREVNFFTREFQKLDINKKQFKEGYRLQDLLEDANPIFRKDALLISTLATFNGELTKKIKLLFENLIPIEGLSLGDAIFRKAGDDFIHGNDKIRKQTLDLLKYADTGINDLALINKTKNEINGNQDIDNSKTIYTSHIKFDGELKPIDKPVAFHLDLNESEGTLKLYELAPSIFFTLEKGGILAIDEFDARLHPRLSKKIIEIFNDPRTNPKNAQLLVVTHDTNLLSANLFRRDQILFVEKDKYGASHLYSLAQFKGVRNDASFESDYLMGRYGAVPFLNNLNAVFAN